jgi:hypothetical protein
MRTSVAKAVVVAGVPDAVPVPAVVVLPPAVPLLVPVPEAVPPEPLLPVPLPLLVPLPDEPAAVVDVLFDPPPPPHAAIVRTTTICTLRPNHRARSVLNEAFPDRRPRMTTSVQEDPERIWRRASGSRAERH